NRNQRRNPGSAVAPRPQPGRVATAGENSREKYRDIANSDQKFEDFAFALTGKTAEERTPEENRALKQLRQEMREGKIDPEVVQADPANGSGDDKLPPGARGAYVSGGKGRQGRVLISPTLRGQQLQRTSDEEQGEAVSDRARQLGIGVADGDAGARVSGVANGRKVTRASDPGLFRNAKSDTITVVSNGQHVTAEAQAGPVQPTSVSATPQPGWAAGGDGNYYDLTTLEGQRAHMKSYDANGDNQLDRTEFHAAMTSIDGGMTSGKADRMMRVYGYSIDNENYFVPIGPARTDNPAVWAGTGTDKIYADGVVQQDPAGGGGYVTDLGRVGADTVANAMTRHAAFEAYKHRKPSDTRPPEVWITHYQRVGMTAVEMDAATDHVLGDTKPFSSKNGHRDVVAANFGYKDESGTQRITRDGLTHSVIRGAIKIEPGQSGDFIAFSAHREPVGPTAMPNTHADDSSPVTNNFTFGMVNHANLWMANASHNDKGQALGSYATPHIREVADIAFGGVVGTAKDGVDGNRMERKDNGDGTVIWVFHGHVKSAYDQHPITYTVPAGSKEDRYLQDYKEFSSPPPAGSENRPHRNLERTAESPGPDGEQVEVWMPREHQFGEVGHDGRTTEATFTTPVVTVDGQEATVVDATPVTYADGSSAYFVTAKTKDGKTVTTSVQLQGTGTPEGNAQWMAFDNLNMIVNGTPKAPLDFSSAESAAAALDSMPPDQAAAYLDRMGHDDAVAILSAMPPAKAADLLARMRPHEAAEILETMGGTKAANLINALPSAKPPR
ncbi:MAG: hypothetical protein HC844_16270, partial [Tabrizicola sp.]|nr:hypothetical protein [Tabrizicola sp.]